MISSTTNTTSSGSAASSGASAAGVMNSGEIQDRFLKLLVAQINNQDPMNPLDNAQMTSQMAQINTVTGIQQVNDTLKGLADQFASLQVMQGLSMVGHHVLVQGNTLVNQNGTASGGFELKGDADAVKVEVLSPSGMVVGSLNLGPLKDGRHTFDWDSSGYQGQSPLKFRVNASLKNQPVTSTPLAFDRVISVGKDNGAMTVQLQSGNVTSYADIKAIY